MASIAGTVVDVSPNGDGSCYQVIWTPVTSADTPLPVSFPKHNDRSIQVAGTFDSSTTVVQGSNDGTNYAGLFDPSSTAISITTAKIKAVLENTVWIKPVVSGGGGSQSLTISMLFHLGNPART